jgi:hypothetical protein
VGAVVCEPVSLLFAEYQRDSGQKEGAAQTKMREAPAAQVFLSFRLNSISGRKQGAAFWRNSERPAEKLRKTRGLPARPKAIA